jgi:hypothetical protein
MMSQRGVGVRVIRMSRCMGVYDTSRCTTGSDSFLSVQAARYHILRLTRRILSARACLVNVSHE